MKIKTLLQTAAALSLCLLMNSCSSRQAETRGHYFSVRQEDGITIAVTSSIPKYEGELFRYEKVLELREDERPESLFNRPTDFLADSQGRFYVADSGDARIAVFSPEGSYLRSIGRRGEGPGEFQAPRIQSIRNDIISVYDLLLRREVRYRTDGTLVDITSIPADHSHRPNEYFRLDEERMAQIIRQYEDVENDRYEWAEILIHTAAPDTVALFATEHVLTGYRFPSVRRGLRIMQRGNYLFAPQPIAYFSPAHGFVLSSGKEPVIDVFDSSGTLQKRIRMDMAAEQVTAGDKDEVIAVFQRDLSEADAETQTYIKEQIDNLRFMEYKPPWYAFMVDDVGFFWLIDIDTLDLQDVAEHGFDMMVLDKSGEYLGRTRFPPALFLRFSNGRLLINNQDPETGEYSLTVYQIIPAVSGLIYP